MARSKYINTFDTTAEYNNYIESALPSFPNVGYDKEADKVNIVRTSPNDHVWYGEVVDPAQALPTISLNGTTNNTTLDELKNTFYLDSWSNAAPTSIEFGNKTNIKTIKKLKGLDTSNVTDMQYMFYNCSSLTSLDLSNFDTSNVTNMNRMFGYCQSLTSLDLSSFNTSNVTDIGGMLNACSSLTSLDLSNFDTSNVTNVSEMFSNCISLKDVYITVEATLMKLTGNLTGNVYNSAFIPSNGGQCTIHYNSTDYKWQNNRWTPQS